MPHPTKLPTTPRARRLSLLLSPLLLLAAAGSHARTTAAADAAMNAALAAAQRGQLTQAQSEALRADPRWPWLEFARLSRNLDSADAGQVRAFLQRHDGQAAASALRERWLASRSRRQDWDALLADWRPQDDPALRCARLNALHALGRADATWNTEAQALWRNGKSMPDACNPVFTALAARGALDDALRWERFDLAVAEGEPAVMRAAASGLPPAAKALAEDYAAFVQAPHGRTGQWPRDARSRKVASAGLTRLARKAPGEAEAQLARIGPALGMTDAERGPVLYQVALQTVASYLPASGKRLAAVPESAYDERLHEFRVREALARSDWSGALQALRKLPADMRNDARWQWFEARMLEKLGRGPEALAMFQRAATAPNFHGFMAADRLNLPYALCPWAHDETPALRAEVAADPAIVRALALYRIERPGWAVREWNEAMARFDDVRRRIAVAVAQEGGWFDRGVFALGRQPEEQRLYTLRFPLHHDEEIRAAARRHALDPAWIAAEIRAESIFNPRARSSANALGLMQLLPGTAAAVARRIGLAYSGAQSLYEPATNIALGSAYLRQMEDKYAATYQAIAAYNAGPGPVARWLSQRGGLDPDLWIETITYKETREYVARVLAFSVIYDWRLNGDALPVTDRLMGRTEGRRKPFACPAPVR